MGDGFSGDLAVVLGADRLAEILMTFAEGDPAIRHRLSSELQALMGEDRPDRACGHGSR
ncbi:MAG: hypothetical protein FWD68_18455 [Alphaproteobacteria bacterium]|nr:hypothetical protein [Alphaproteobacteria bacterium]